MDEGRGPREDGQWTRDEVRGTRDEDRETCGERRGTRDGRRGTGVLAASRLAGLVVQEGRELRASSIGGATHRRSAHASPTGIRNSPKQAYPAFHVSGGYARTPDAHVAVAPAPTFSNRRGSSPPSPVLDFPPIRFIAMAKVS